MTNMKKIAVNILFVLATIIIVGGGTYAFWTWVVPEEEETNVIFKTPSEEEIKDKLSAKIDGSGNVEVADLKPDLCNGETAVRKEVVISYLNQTKKTATISASLEVPSELFVLATRQIIENNESTNQILLPTQANLEKLKFALTTGDKSCDDGIAVNVDEKEIIGNFSSLIIDDETKKNEKLTLFTHSFIAPAQMISEETKTYYLWIWLDIEYTHINVGNRNDDPMQGITFTTQWSGEIIQNSI